MKIIAIICFIIAVILLAKRNQYIKINQDKKNEFNKYNFILGCLAVAFEIVGVICLFYSL